MCDAYGELLDTDAIPRRRSFNRSTDQHWDVQLASHRLSQCTVDFSRCDSFVPKNQLAISLEKTIHEVVAIYNVALNLRSIRDVYTMDRA
jgi:hypothetical protein